MASLTGPLIPETYIDAPAQRLYVLSLGLLCQAIKVFDLTRYLFHASESTSFVGKWVIADALFILGLSQLRIPRLTYTRSSVALQLCLASILNGFIFGGLFVDVGLSPFSRVGSTDGTSSSTRTLPGVSDALSSVGLGMLVPGSSSNLLGQHTVRMSPVSTAELNSDGHRYCIASHTSPLLIPVLLNNTNPSVVRYSLTPLNGSEQHIEYFDVSPRDLRLAELSRGNSHRNGAPSPSTSEEDEYDDEEATEEKGPTLQKTQTVAYIPITRPGVLRLERVIHSNSVDARLAYPTSLVIAPCPSAAFVADKDSAHSFIRCLGSHEDIRTDIDISGVPPLSLRYSRHHKHVVEHFDVEGIDGHRQVRQRSHAPQTVRTPLDLAVGAAGTHFYILESVMDGLGNQVLLQESPSALIKSEMDHPGHLAKEKPPFARAVHVLSRPQLSFEGCNPSSPARLLKGQEATLTLRATDVDVQDWPLQATVSFEPLAVEDGKGVSISGQAWTKTLQIDGRISRFQASSAGLYTLQSGQGKNCEAEVLNPDSCRVVELPRPSADIEWKRIHECSGDTGVYVTMVLHGTPPFQVYYRTQRNNEHAREDVKVISGSRGELSLKPEHSGHYSYIFLSLSDANYKKVPLNGPSIEQSVHPLASVDFSLREHGGGRKQINSCAGNIVDVDVDLKGTGPWNIEVQTVDAAESKTISFDGITSSRKTLQIPLPERIDKEGGTFTVDLVSVEDANGCKRSVSVPGIAINVRRIQPTARFYGKPEQRRVSALQDALADLPLRLTGESPWTLKYRRTEDPSNTMTARVASPNGHLSVQGQGTYEIISVLDSQCPGSVAAENTFVVTWVDRPFAKIASETPVVLDPISGNYILPAVCEHVDDHVELDLTGRAPFQVVYNIARDGIAGGTDLIDEITFNSIQPRTRFQLHASEAGKKYYEVKQIGDASYPISKNQQTIPRAERLLFSQEVLSRPAAAFKQRGRLSYCYEDVFASKSSSDGVVVLLGTPPFEVRVSVKDLAVGEIHEETVTISGTTWAFALPSYTFKSVGPHLVTIESVQDASHCEQAALDPLRNTMWVDVAETAAIVPYDRREHFCVGDPSQFQLEGIPPWSIGYSINGKTHTKQSSQSPFAMVQQQPGEFAIHSIAHQNKMCTTTIQDLRWDVHPLPAATVGHGKKVIQNIYEGDQAEILFTLAGEPPFTFTYQRSQLATKKGKPGKVLETHTVTGVMKKEYSIFSALEGTWTVAFISDRYCRYPPIQSNTS